METNPANVEPPPILLIKETSVGNPYGDYVKLKLRRGRTSITSDLCEFRIYLFDHVKQEEFLFFMRNFRMTLAATGTLEAEAKVQYLHMVVREESLRQFDLLSADAKI